MATLREVERECERLNRRNRNVVEHRMGALNPRTFWRSAVGTNFVITGGMAATRRGILCDLLPELSLYNEPVIILNGSHEFENDIIYMAQQGEIGELKIASDEYKTFDLFSGMDNDEINAVIEALAQDMAFADVQGITDYARAFLNILSSRYNPSLRSMMQLAEYEDPYIANFGKGMGVSENNIDRVRNGVEAGRAFRQVLYRIHAAVSYIQSTQDQERVFDLCSINDYRTYVINISSGFPSDINTIFAHEMRALQKWHRPFTLILNEVELASNERLLNVLRDLKNGSYCNLGVCAQNIISWMGYERDALANFPVKVILYEGSQDEMDLDEALKRLGAYDYYEPSFGVGMPARVFVPMPWDGHKHVDKSAPISRPRVRVQDLRVGRFIVAVQGHNGGAIDLYRNISF